MSGVLGFCLLMGVTAAIWWRNHDILSDLYDYSSMMAAAGKIEAGLKPYVDFRSTMQSATYLLNRGAEIAFGRSYLGLTVGGLTFSLVGTVALFALSRRAMGTGGGLVLAAAVAWSGLGQHVVVFYNTTGILCLALVMVGVATNPRMGTSWSWDRVLVIGALFLGGLNKINFQFLTLALASVLVIHAFLAGKMDRRGALASLLTLVGAGLLAPLMFELIWTGASPALWFENVVLLAGERMEYCRRLVEPAVYFGPAHDLHHHIPFKQLTAVGLILLSVTGWQALLEAWRERGAKWSRVAVVFVYLAGAAVGGVLLTVTNVESIALTSLGLLLAAVGLHAATRPVAAVESKRLRIIEWGLAAGCCFWAINGGVAAWKGSRILYAREDDNRAVFVRMHSAPPALQYLEGVRLDANLHRSLLLAAKELDREKDRRGNLSGMLFGPAFEWLERAFPEAIRRGAPVWYHVGTSLREDDGGWLTGLLDQHGVDRILAHPDWETWPGDFQTWLNREYRSVSLGPMARIHEKIGSEQFTAARGSFGSEEPLTLIERTSSNLHLLSSPVPEGFAFATSPWGDYIGREGAWQWDWCEGLSIVEGVFVAQRPEGMMEKAQILVTAHSLEADGTTQELWRDLATVEVGQEWTRLPFRITPYGRPVRIQARPEQSDQRGWRLGCREVQVKQTVPTNELSPPPVTAAPKGTELTMDDGKAALLRSSEAGTIDRMTWYTNPAEMWTKRAAGSGPWQVTIETEQKPEEGGTPPVVMLLWYRSGRIELLSQQAITPQSPGEISFDGWMAEPGGWLGVAIRPLEQGKTFATKVRVKNWTF